MNEVSNDKETKPKLQAIGTNTNDSLLQTHEALSNFKLIKKKGDVGIKKKCKIANVYMFRIFSGADFFLIFFFINLKFSWNCFNHYFIDLNIYIFFFLF